MDMFQAYYDEHDELKEEEIEANLQELEKQWAVQDFIRCVDKYTLLEMSRLLGSALRRYYGYED